MSILVKQWLQEKLGESFHPAPAPAPIPAPLPAPAPAPFYAPAYSEPQFTCFFLGFGPGARSAALPHTASHTPVHQIKVGNLGQNLGPPGLPPGAIIYILKAGPDWHRAPFPLNSWPLKAGYAIGL